MMYACRKISSGQKPGWKLMTPEMNGNWCLEAYGPDLICLLFSTGAFCIPVYLPYILTGKWMLGRGLCKLWLVMDYLLCTASVFNIVLISYDRFLSVTRAVSHLTLKCLVNIKSVTKFSYWECLYKLCKLNPDRKKALVIPPNTSSTVQWNVVFKGLIAWESNSFINKMY